MEESNPLSQDLNGVFIAATSPASGRVRLRRYDPPLPQVCALCGEAAVIKRYVFFRGVWGEVSCLLHPGIRPPACMMLPLCHKHLFFRLLFRWGWDIPRSIAVLLAACICVMVLETWRFPIGLSAAAACLFLLAWLSARARKIRVTQWDGRHVVLTGLDPRFAQACEDMERRRREARAHHEAGHAVIGLHLGLPPESVVIKEGDSFDALLGGWRHVRPPDTVLKEMEFVRAARDQGRDLDESTISSTTWEWIENLIRSTLAGPLAEERLKGGRPDPESSDLIHDQEAVKVCARMRWDAAERMRHLQNLETEVAGLLAQPKVWEAVKGVALVLLKRDSLAGPEVRDLYHTAMRDYS